MLPIIKLIEDRGYFIAEYNPLFWKFFGFFHYLLC